MLNVILFYDDRGRWWQPGNFLTKVIDSSSHINVYNHGVIAEDIGVLDSLDKIAEKVDIILVIDSGKTQHKIHHHMDKIKETDTKTAIWLSDTHLDYTDRKRWVSECRYDYVFVAQKDAVERIVRECKYDPSRVIWLPHAVDTDIFQPTGTYQKQYDAVSVGFMNENRKRLFPVIGELINFKHKSTIWAWSVNKAYQEAKIGVNVPVFNDPLNMRCFEIGAAKIPQLIGYPKGNSNGLFELFEDGKDLLSFELDDVEKMKDLVTKLIIDQDLRNELAENMYKKVIENHTYKHRLNTILTTMEFEGLPE